MGFDRTCQSIISSIENKREKEYPKCAVEGEPSTLLAWAAVYIAQSEQEGLLFSTDLVGHAV